MPRGPGKKENYNLDYSRFNAFDRDEAEEPSKDKERGENDAPSSEADAAAGKGPSAADMRELLAGMPPEMREAFHLMQIAKENGDPVAQERASELALKAVEKGGPEIQNAFMKNVGEQMPEIAGKLSKSMAGFAAGGGTQPGAKQLLKEMQDEATRQAVANKLAEENEDSEIRISTLKSQMEEGQKATRKEMENLEKKQSELEGIRNPEDFMKFMQEEGITDADLQRIFSGDEKFMQSRLNDSAEKCAADGREGNGSKDAAAALKKVDKLHSTLFGEDTPEEEKAPEPLAIKAPEPPAEPEVVIPMYRLQYQKDEKGKYTVVELKCSLPGVADMSCVNLDVSEKHLRLSTMAPAPRYAVNAGPFPVLIDPSGARAKYSKKREELSITVPCKV